MSITHRQPRPRPDGEQGLTLVELLVAAMLTAVVLSAGYGAMFVMGRSLHSTGIQTDNIDQLRLGIAAASRDLRAATDPVVGTPAFERADPDGAAFFTRVGPTPQVDHVELRVVDGELRQVRTPVALSSDGEIELLDDASTERTLARGLIDGIALLTYRDADGDAMSELSDDADRRGIRVIEIRMRVATDGTALTRPTDLATTVRLPNLRGGSS